MTRRVAVVLVACVVLAATTAVVVPALIVGRAPRHARAGLALPGWAASQASTLFGALAAQRHPRAGTVQQAPALPAAPHGTTCYLAGGSVCSASACMRYIGAQATVVVLTGPSGLTGRFPCARPAAPLTPKIVPIRMP